MRALRSLVLLWLSWGIALGTASAEERVSKTGRYRVSLSARTTPIPVNEWHEWVVHVARADGAAPQLRDLALDGGMPAHGHGLPTAPVVTRSSSPGDFVVRGMRFNMCGRWELRVLLADDEGEDGAVFPVDV